MTARRYERPFTGTWVDQEGERSEDGCPNCEWFESQLAGAEKDLRAWRTRYGNLSKDRDAEARKHPLYPKARALHAYWRKTCKHPRSGFKSLHFELVLSFLEDEKRYGEKMCMRAIEGAAFDPFITTMRNGKKERHDHFELIFKSPKSMERFCNKAPTDWDADGQARLEVEE